MALRKWLVRTLALCVFVLLGGGYWLVQAWTNPQKVRELAMQTLGAKLPGVEVRLAGAEVRLLGGVTLFDLRCAFRGDGDQNCFAVLPETVLYPDKERLTRGQLALRKLVLKRPVLMLLRQADGAFNLAQLALPAGAGDLSVLPLIEIENATITLQDLACAAPPVKLTQGNLELTPLDERRYRVTGEGQLDLVGPCRCQGTVDTQTGETQLTFSLPELILGEELFDRLSLHVPEWKKLKTDLSGQLALQVQLALAPSTASPTSYRLSGELKQGSLSHPELPGTASELAGRFSYAGRQLQIEKASGRFLDGTFELEGAATADGDLCAKLTARRWRISPPLYGKLPGAIRKLCEEYQPDGRLSAAGELTYIGGKLGFSYEAHPEGLSVLFDDLPYPVHEVQGNILYHEPNGEPQMTMHLAGKASGQPVQLRGRLFGAGLRPDNDYKCGFDLELVGENVPVDGVLLKALAPYPFTARTLSQFHAEGKFAVRAKLDREAGPRPGVRAPLRKEIVAQIDQAKFKFDEFPYPLEQGQATLTILSDDSWRFENLSATRQGGWVFGKGQMTPTPAGDYLKLNLRAVNVPLDAELKAAVPQEAKDAWDEIRPVGRVDGEVDLGLVIGQGKPKIDLTLRPRACSVKPRFFPYLVSDLTGSARWRDQTLTLHRMAGVHGQARMMVQDGKVAFGENGSIRAELFPIYAEKLVCDSDFMEATPKPLRAALETLQPDQPVTLLANLTLETDSADRPWRCGWNGHVDFSGCKLHAGLELNEVHGRIALRGSHDGEKLRATGRADLAQAVILRQPFQHLGFDFDMTQDQIKLTELSGRLHGGLVKGQVDVRLLDPIWHESYVRADGVDLGLITRYALEKRGPVQGRVSAGMTLNGRGKEIRSLRGQGWLKIDQGAHLCELPIVLELANHLSRLMPKATSFQDAAAVVNIEGERLTIHRFDLMSDALSLRGHGGVNVDGSALDLQLFGIPYGRTMPNLPPVLDRIPPTLSKQLMRIHATGALTNVQIATEPLPVLLDPIRDMLKTFGERPADPEPAKPNPPFDLRPPPGPEVRR